ncbi:hypothetical protein Q1695_003724 [Nippostrongylus brasiliensis]|nr:hypothetical protein Q1695_003724 [Nippostrongylus brasiliensis]
MSEPHLFVPGDGLCTTYVTWNDLEEDMQRSLKTSARFGPNKSFNDIGDGKGFASKILLINPDWQSQQEDLPEQFVAKIVTMLAIEQLNSKNGDQDGTEGKGKNHTTELEHMLSTERFLKRGHNVEIAAYKLLAKIPEGKIKIPQIYSTKPFTDNNPVKGYILMEYCKDVEGAQMHRNIAPENLKPALKYLAVVTANSLNASQEERKEFHETMHKNALESDYLLQLWKSNLHTLETWADGKFAAKAKRLESIYSDILDVDRADNMADECGMQRVLCHGDFWPGNILWRSEEGQLRFFTVVDFQTAHFGCTAADLVRLFTVGLSGADRRKHWEKLLEVFYEYLLEEVGDRLMPYTLEQLKESYRRVFPIGTGFVVVFMAHVFETVVQNPIDEQRQEIIEKTEYLLDDMFHYYERNVELRKNGH